MRVTVTSRTLHHQTEIARYLCERLRPDEIHVEPLYLGGRAGARDTLRPEQAAAFVDGFLEARGVAAGFGVPMFTSGSRMSEIHGPYCNVFRDVLQLVPGGVVTACFKAAEGAESDARGMTIGRCGSNGNRLVLDRGRITMLRQRLGGWPPRCRNCFNRFHCTLGCPDSCPVQPETDASDFRCRVQKTLSLRVLDGLAEVAWKDAKRRHRVVGHEVGAP